MKTLFPVFLLFIVSAFAMAQPSVQLPRSEFTISLSESTFAAKPGERKSVTVSILRSKSFSKQKAALSTSPLPKGVSVTYEPAEGFFETTTATLAVAPDAAAGEYQIVLSAALSGKKKGSILKLIVDAK